MLDDSVSCISQELGLAFFLGLDCVVVFDSALIPGRRLGTRALAQTARIRSPVSPAADFGLSVTSRLYRFHTVKLFRSLFLASRSVSLLDRECGTNLARLLIGEGKCPRF